MSFITDWEKKLPHNKRSLFRLGFWTIIHTISIVILSQIVIYLGISNLWIALGIFGVGMTVISGVVNKFAFNFDLRLNGRFVYFIVVHILALLFMNTFVVPLTGVSSIIARFIITGFGVALIARIAKQKLAKKIIIAGFALLILGSIPLTGDIGQLADLGFFVITIYLIAMSAWLALQFINSLDMHSDLTLWGIRIIGFIVAGFALLLFMSAQWSMLLMNVYKTNLGYSGYIPTILSIAIGIIGLFMIFRSNRRYTIIGFW